MSFRARSDSDNTSVRPLSMLWQNEFMDTAQWRILVDSPKSKPQLGFREPAEALTSLILNTPPRFAIGIFGRWGTGKTTLMNAVRDSLTKEQTVVVEFSAWRYEREDHLLLPLLDSLRDAMAGWGNEAIHHGTGSVGAGNPRRAAALRKVAGAVGHVLGALVAGFSLKVGISESVQASYEANKVVAALGRSPDGAKTAPDEADVSRSAYYAGFKGLKTAFEELRREHPDLRVVVFVDDLDRCLPHNMVEVLESIKLFFDLDGFVFIVGVDNTKIQEAIELRYARTEQHESSEKSRPIASGLEYLKKIFQVPFSLPVIRREQLGDLLQSFISPDIQQTQSEAITGVVRRHLEYTTPGETYNPREVKRFVNDFTIQMMVDQSLDPDAVLALATLQSRSDWAPVYDALLAHGVEYHQFLRESLDPDAETPTADPAYPDLSFGVADYLRSGPGNGFLRVSEVSKYISSAEALHSSEGGSSRETTEASRMVIRVRKAATAASEREDEDARGRLTEAIDKIRNLASQPFSNERGWPALTSVVPRLCIRVRAVRQERRRRRAVWSSEFERPRPQLRSAKTRTPGADLPKRSTRFETWPASHSLTSEVGRP